MPMSSRLIGGLLTLAVLGACDRKPAPESEIAPKSEAKPPCDQAKLATLAEQLNAAEPDQRLALVSAGLLDACPGSLYSPAEFLFAEIANPDQPQPPRSLSEDRGTVGFISLTTLDALLAQGTPVEIAKAVYQLHDEAQLREAKGTVGFIGFVTWTTHGALLAQGTPVEIARAISRAVFLVELNAGNPMLVRRLPGQTLVAADVNTPIPSGTIIHISATELVFNDRPIARLDAGKLPAEQVESHVIVALFGQLEEETNKLELLHEALGEKEWDRTLVIVADPRVAFATVVDSVYTASRLGFSRFAFVVERAHPIHRAILFEPPKFGPGAPQPAFKAFITDDGYYVFDRPGERVALPKLDPNGTGPSAWDRDKLVEAAKQAVAANPELVRAVVSAENHISTDVLIATYAALLGPGCDQVERTSCLLPELIIEAGAG